MLLDSRQLRLFVAICEDMHFKRAAERLGIAQSVLSKQLQRIEDVLGGRLLERGRRARVSLTPAGNTFLAEARAAVARLDRAERIGRLAVRGAAGPARLAYVFSAAMSGVLPRALRAIRSDLPELKVDAFPLETAEQIAAIADARIDAGFIRPRPSYPADIVARVIHREPLLIAMADTHPLASHPMPNAAALAAERFIVPRVSESMGLSTAVAALARAGGFCTPELLDTGDFVTAASLAAAEHGVVLAPRSLATLGMAGLVYREIDGYSGTVDLALAWRCDETALVATILRSLEPVPHDDGLPCVGGP